LGYVRRNPGGSDARYFALDFVAGDPIVFELFTSPASDPAFVPKLALAGPGVMASGLLPEGVNVRGLPTHVYSGERSVTPDLEPATPNLQYFILKVEAVAPATGRYYAVVFSKTAGRFGLAGGAFEGFTLCEWITLPVVVLRTYRWEGQSLLIVFLPFAAVVALGAAVEIWRVRRGQAAWYTLPGVLAGYTFLGSAALYGTQVLRKVFTGSPSELWFLPVVMITAQILLGIGVIRSASKRRPIRTALYGAMGLFAWAGYVVGPAAAVASAFTNVVQKRQHG
jgi:hypothetical protein